MYQKREVSLPVGTKQQNLKQETGNDYDVISGLKVLQKTDFSVIFLCLAKKFTQKMVQKCIVYKKMRNICRGFKVHNLIMCKWKVEVVVSLGS